MARQQSTCKVVFSQAKSWVGFPWENGGFIREKMGKSWQFPPWSSLICGTLIESNGGKIWLSEKLIDQPVQFATWGVLPQRAVFACSSTAWWEGSHAKVDKADGLDIATPEMRFSRFFTALMYHGPPEAAAEYGMSFVVWEGYMGLSEHGAYEIPWYDKYPHSGPHWIMRIPNEQYFVCRSPYGYGPWVKTAIPQRVGLSPKMTKGGWSPWSLILTHSHGNHELIHEFRYWSSTYLYMYVCNVCNVM